MWVDSQNLFSDAQAVTSTAISTNVIDTVYSGTAPLANLGNGAVPLCLVVITNTTCTDTSSDATLTLTLESDSTADLATSPTVHYTTGALSFATYATAGTEVCVVPLPKGNYERYLGLRYTIASGPLTAGKFDAFLTTDVQAYRSYDAGRTV